MKSVLAFFVVCSFALTAVAEVKLVRDPSAPPVAKSQKTRIQSGVKSGTLTRKEAHKLRQEQGEIRLLKRSVASDGQVTKEEKKEVRKARREASRHIYKEKHDKQARHP